MATIPELLTLLREKRSSLQGLDARSGALLNDLEEAAKDCEARAAMHLETGAQLHADDIRSLGGITAAGWDSAFWGNYSGDQNVALKAIRLGRSVELNLLPGERGIHGMPAVVPFLAAQGTLLIIRDEQTRPHARALIQSILLRSVLAMPEDIRYTLIGSDGAEDAFQLRDILPRVRVAVAGQSVADQLGAVEGDIYRVTADFAGRGRLIDMSREERRGEQFELIVALDFPANYASEPDVPRLLTKVGNRGPRAGRYLVVEVRGDRPLPEGFSLEEFEHAQIVDLRADQSVLVVDNPMDRETEERLVAAALKKPLPARRNGQGGAPRNGGAGAAAASYNKYGDAPGDELLPLWFDNLNTPLQVDAVPGLRAPAPGSPPAASPSPAPSPTPAAAEEASNAASFSREGAMLIDNPYVLIWSKLPPAADMLEKVARSPEDQNGFGIVDWSAEEKPVPLWLGRRFDAFGHALAILRRVPNSNLLMVGSQPATRLAALSSALAALVAMLPAAGVELDIVDGLATGQPCEGMLKAGAAPLLARGAKVRLSRPEQVASVLERLAADVKRRSLGPGARRTILLVIAQPDRIPALHIARNSKAPPPKGAPADLREILLNGPQFGVHVILSASSVATVGSVLNPKSELGAFDLRVAQPVNEDDSMTLFKSLAGAQITAQSDHPAAMLLADLSRGAKATTLFRGYAGKHATDVKPATPQLAAVFNALFG